MVFAITEIWKAFIEKRDFSGNIGTSMDKAKQKKLLLQKIKKGHVEKSSKTIIKPTSRKLKKWTTLIKSETKNKYSGDDYQSKKILSTQLKYTTPAEDFSFKKIDTMSDDIRESGQSFGSQETISDNSMFSEV